MAQYFNIKDASVALIGTEASLYLQSLASGREQIAAQARVNLEVRHEDDGIHLTWYQCANKPIRFHLDYVKLVDQLRSYPAPKQGALNQAIGRKSKSILDASGGWGSDALLLCTQGYEVTVFERQQLMATILSEAFDRLSRSYWARTHAVSVPRVVYTESSASFDPKAFPADCVYFDPMFPAKRKKSAAVNKYMQFLQWFAGTDSDSANVLQKAITVGYQRVIVKRPDSASPLLPNPTTQFSSKLVHYDVYLNH